MSKKIHYLGDLSGNTFCNKLLDSSIKVTEDKMKVTCKTCLSRFPKSLQSIILEKQEDFLKEDINQRVIQCSLERISIIKGLRARLTICVNKIDIDEKRQSWEFKTNGYKATLKLVKDKDAKI